MIMVNAYDKCLQRNTNIQEYYYCIHSVNLEKCLFILFHLALSISVCLDNTVVTVKWAAMLGTVHLDMCAQRRFRSACAFAQSDQNLLWTHFGYQIIQSFFMRTAKTLIGLRRWPGWFESSSGTHMRKYVFSYCGLYDYSNTHVGSRGAVE